MFRIFGYMWRWAFPHPWRQSSTWDIETMKKEVMKEEKEEKQINLLILGPVGAGKSSFINSIISIEKNRQYGMAAAHGKFTKSWTKKLDEYRCRNLRLFDCVGVAQTEEEGFLIDDLLFLIKGNIMEGYVFDPVKSIKQNGEEGKRFFKDEPGLNDQMHCVIFIVDSTSINSTISGELVEKIDNLQVKLCDEHIPRILILTKVDKLCDMVANNIKNVFRSRAVQQIVKTASEKFGIEEASIHPVKNYVDDFDILNEMNIPLLIALRQAKNYAEDRIEYVLQHKEGQ